MYVMDHPSKWEYHIHLVEFSCNNGYRASLKMSLFESLYGKQCNTSMSWDNPADKEVVGPDLLKEMEENMEKIKQNSKVTQDRKNIYADKNRFFVDIKVGVLKSKGNEKFDKIGKFPKVGSKIL
jgi:hypothetical protein